MDRARMRQWGTDEATRLPEAVGGALHAEGTALEDVGVNHRRAHVGVAQLGRPVIRASIDGFHNRQATRRSRGSLSPEGYFHDSFNYAALVEALLRPLGPGGSRSFRRVVFDFRTDEPVAAEVEKAPSDAVLLLDGVFLLREELREHFDFSVFVRADFAVTTQRAEQRDVQLFGSVDEVRRRYRERYVPGQQLYLRASQPERWASMILDNNDPTAPQIEAAV